MSKAIIGIANFKETAKDLMTVAARIDAGEQLPSADYQLNFATASELFRELTPKRLELLDILKRSGPLSVYRACQNPGEELQQRSLLRQPFDRTRPHRQGRERQNLRPLGRRRNSRLPLRIDSGLGRGLQWSLHSQLPPSVSQVPPSAANADLSMAYLLSGRNIKMVPCAP